MKDRCDNLNMHFHLKLIRIKGTFDDFYKVTVHWSFNIPFVTWSLITVHDEASYKVTLNAYDTIDLICKARLSVIWTTMICFSGWNSNGWNQFDMARNKKTNRWPIFGKLIRNLQHHFYCQFFFFEMACQRWRWIFA